MECQELQCCVCDQDYNDHQIPRNLICGHSFCSSCLEILIPISKRCPECRTVFSENQASELPINYPLLRLSRMFTHEKIGPTEFPMLNFSLGSSSSKLQQDAGKCSSHGCPLFFMCISCSVWVCRECLVVNHPDPPRGRCFILSVTDAIDKIKRSHMGTIDKYLNEANMPRDKLKRDIGIFEITLKSLQILSQEGDGNNKELQEIENQRQSAQAMLCTLENIEKSLREAKEQLSNSNSPKDITISMEVSTDCQSSFEKFVEMETNKTMPNILNMLLRAKKDLKELLEAGKPVYIARQDADKYLWAQIVLIENHLQMYTLRNDPPPVDGIILQFEAVRELVPKESPLIFFEVGWGGEMKGRVYVRLFGDNSRTRQAIILCSGEKGSSYRNTCFYGLQKTDDIPYILQGGDYEHNNGRRGRMVVDRIFDCIEDYHEIKAGLFFGWMPSEVYHASTFNIYLMDVPGANEPCAFGQVEQGLDILKEASTRAPVTDAVVMDCGVVIPV